MECRGVGAEFSWDEGCVAAKAGFAAPRAQSYSTAQLQGWYDTDLLAAYFSPVHYTKYNRTIVLLYWKLCMTMPGVK
jgi:hypothetical protein